MLEISRSSLKLIFLFIFAMTFTVIAFTKIKDKGVILVEGLFLKMLALLRSPRSLWRIRNRSVTPETGGVLEDKLLAETGIFALINSQCSVGSFFFSKQPSEIAS